MIKKLIFIIITMVSLLLYASDSNTEPTIKKEVCATKTEGMSKKEKRAIKNCIKRNDPNRLEWALMPVLGANSDVGFIFGANVVFARFSEKRDLYEWRLALLGSAAVGGSGITMQNHAIQFDMPQIGGSNFRIKMRAAYIQRNSQGYYGFGNDAPYTPDDNPNKYRYSVKSPEVWMSTEYTLPKKMELLGGVRFRYSAFDFLPGSVLEEHVDAVDDAGVPILPGSDNHAELVWAVGWNLDTRDDETATTSGCFLQVSTRGSFGALTGTNYTYGGTTLQGRAFLPVAGEYLVLAGRVFSDFMYGTAPFYEFALAGAFPYLSMPGGTKGIRGVPDGRYRGPVKLVLNFEVRSTFIKFNLGSHRFKIGAVAFFDTGRVWMYKKYSYLDGDGVGLKFGTGAGVRLQWGKTVMVRIDVAYSPDANPIGFYFDVGHMF